MSVPSPPSDAPSTPDSGLVDNTNYQFQQERKGIKSERETSPDNIMNLLKENRTRGSREGVNPPLLTSKHAVPMSRRCELVITSYELTPHVAPLPLPVHRLLQAKCEALEQSYWVDANSPIKKRIDQLWKRRKTYMKSPLRICTLRILGH